MKRVVLDTNIIISTLISPQGPTAKLTDYIADNEEILIYYNSLILAEYAGVLSRKKFKIPIEIQNEYLDMIQEMGVIFEPVPSDIPMPDETDRIFYDTAKASDAILITGNTKHYPDEPFIMKPAEYWKLTNN